MDKTRFTANRRLDLVDMTRLITGIENAQSYTLGFLLGSPEYYALGAGDHTQKRAAVIHGPVITNPAAPSLNVLATRTYNDGTHTFDAIMFDKDGQRIAGDRSQTTKSFAATAAPAGTRYIIARRVTSDTTNEARQHYSAAAGKYPANVDTETIDDWEIDETFTVNGAAADTALRDAGWVNIGTYTTNGVSITAVDDYSLGGTLRATLFDNQWMTWAGATPDRRASNVMEAIQSVQQIIRRMRYGFGSSDRDYDDRPTYDACFEEYGGIRFGGGVGDATGLQDTYLRAKDSGSGYDMLTAQPHTVAVGNTLHYMRARGFVAGGSAGNEIDTATSTGFCYGNLVTAKTAVAVAKWWEYSAGEFEPDNSGNGTVHGPAADNLWYQGGTGAGNPFWWSWRYNVGGAVVSASNLVISLRLPHGCLITEMRVTCGITTTAAANHAVNMRVTRYGKTSRAVAYVGNNGTHVQRFPGDGTWPAAGGATQWVEIVYTPSSQTYAIVDNENYEYVCVIWNEALGAIGPSEMRFVGARVKTEIKEASHVY